MPRKTRIVIERQPPKSPNSCGYRVGFVYEVEETDAAWLLSEGYGYEEGTIPLADREARFTALQARLVADSEAARDHTRKQRAAKDRAAKLKQAAEVAADVAAKQAAREAAKVKAREAQLRVQINNAAATSALRIARERKQ